MVVARLAGASIPYILTTSPQLSGKESVLLPKPGGPTIGDMLTVPSVAAQEPMCR